MNNSADSSTDPVSKRVAVLGASPKPDRYANKAIRLLMQHGYEVIPVNPHYDVIEGLPVVPVLSDLEPGSIDTVTLYLGPNHSEAEGSSLLQLKPRRVIFNPGTEHPDLQQRLVVAGVQVQEACTLVLLNTNQF